MMRLGRSPKSRTPRYLHWLRGRAACHGRLQKLRWLLIYNISLELCARRIICFRYFQPRWWCHVHRTDRNCRVKNFFSCISRVCHGLEVCQQMLTNNESWQRAELGRWRKANAETLINALITDLCSFGLTSVRRININDKDKFVEPCLGLDQPDGRCLSCKQRKERILKKYLIFHLAWRSTQRINEPFFFARQVNIDGHLIGDGMRVLKW